MAAAQTLGAYLMLGRNLFTTLILVGLAGTSHAEDYHLIFTGLGGEDYYTEAFAGRAQDLANALQRAGDDNGLVLPTEETTLERIEESFSRLAGQMRPGDRLQLYLVGHGSFDGSTYKFNIDGPDLTGERLLELLNELPEGPQLVVVMTSSSGAVQELLARENRIVITATRNGLQRNAPVFGDYWVAGLTDGAADTNKNELLSAGELYRYTADQVTMHYEQDNLLASEHSVISDEAGAENFVVSRVGMLAAGELSSAAESLLEERSGLEDSIQELMSNRSEMPEDAYFDQLQTLMLELSRVQERIDAELENNSAP